MVRAWRREGARDADLWVKERQFYVALGIAAECADLGGHYSRLCSFPADERERIPL